MNENDLIRYLMQNDINLRIGMSTAMGSTDQYVDFLRDFFDTADFEGLYKALQKKEKRKATTFLHQFEKDTLDLGLINLYEIFIEIDVLLRREEYDSIRDLFEDALMQRLDIMTALELERESADMPYGEAVLHRDNVLSTLPQLMEKEA